MVRPIAFVLALLSLATPALADNATGERPVDQRVDGAIVAGAVAVSLAPMTLRLRGHGLWDTQLLGELDHAVYDQFSGGAARLSDLMLAVTIAAPAVYLTSSPVEDADGGRLGIYAEQPDRGVA